MMKSKCTFVEDRMSLCRSKYVEDLRITGRRTPRRSASPNYKNIRSRIMGSWHSGSLNFHVTTRVADGAGCPVIVSCGTCEHWSVQIRFFSVADVAYLSILSPLVIGGVYQGKIVGDEEYCFIFVYGASSTAGPSLHATYREKNGD